MVTLEVAVGININRMRTVVIDTCRQSVYALILNIHEVVAGDRNHRCEAFATMPIMSGVRIVLFPAIPALLDDSVEGSICPSTIAVPSTTVNEHLFRENFRGNPSDSPLSLHGANGTKSPTGSTLTLVFNSTQHVFIPPIMRIRMKANGIFGLGTPSGFAGHFFDAQQLVPLSLGPGR